jgi:predicted RNA binding protein YcfA (HicA-like mRNA interferase family)
VSKLPRNVSAEQLVKALVRMGYRVVRQTGSHMRMKGGRSGEAPLTIPRHHPVKVGTLAGIIDDVMAHTAMTREQVLKALDL